MAARRSVKVLSAAELMMSVKATTESTQAPRLSWRCRAEGVMPSYAISRQTSNAPLSFILHTARFVNIKSSTCKSRNFFYIYVDIISAVRACWKHVLRQFKIGSLSKPKTVNVSGKGSHQRGEAQTCLRYLKRKTSSCGLKDRLEARFFFLEQQACLSFL